MATFQTCLSAYQRADKTYCIQLRVIHHRKSRRISTNMYARPEDLTRGLNIKNDRLNRKCRELEERCMDICNEMGYAVEGMDVDELIVRIKAKFNGDDRFHLDFFQYVAAEAAKMSPGTGAIYNTSVNALKRYVRKDSLDISEITTSFIKGFIEFLRTEPSQSGANRKSSRAYVPKPKGNRAIPLYVSRIKTMYERAKQEFNDEERDIVPIKGNPFRNLHLGAGPTPTNRALPAEVIQRIIDLPPFGRQRVQLGRDCFLLSFALMGMNAVDLLTCDPAKNGEIVYYRKKTTARRQDRAEMHVRIEPCIEPLVAKYADKTRQRLFNLHLRYANRQTLTRALNEGLEEVGKAVGITGLTFYAARHSWATIARAPRTERVEGEASEIGGAGLDKYLVHDALNHVDSNMKVTDIYLKKDWRILWNANKAVLGLFDWSNLK